MKVIELMFLAAALSARVFAQSTQPTTATSQPAPLKSWATIVNLIPGDDLPSGGRWPELQLSRARKALSGLKGRDAAMRVTLRRAEFQGGSFIFESKPVSNRGIRCWIVTAIKDSPGLEKISVGDSVLLSGTIEGVNAEDQSGPVLVLGLRNAQIKRGTK